MTPLSMVETYDRDQDRKRELRDRIAALNALLNGYTEDGRTAKRFREERAQCELELAQIDRRWD